MKKYDILKFSYYTVFALFFSIVSSTIFTLFHLKVPTIPLLFSISLICMFIYFLLIKKGVKPWITIIISEATAILQLSFITHNGETIWGSLLVFFILIYVYKNWNIDVNYGMIIFHIKRFFKLLVILGLYVSVLCYAEVFTRDVTNMFIMYIAFFLLSILVVREGRIYSYKIKIKKNLFIDALLIVSIIILSIKELMMFFINLFAYIFNIVYNAIFNCFAYLVNLLYIYILKPLIDKLRPLFHHALKSKTNKQQTTNSNDLSDTAKKLADSVRDYNKGVHMSNSTEIILTIIIVAIIAIVVIKLIKKHNSKAFNSGSYITEKREKIVDKIDDKSKEKKNSFMKKLASILKLNKDNNFKILLLYKGFLNLTYIKGFFKKHMTPTELKSKMINDKYDTDSLKVITEVYNEAKFSNHKLNENASELMEKSINNINKELKGRD